MTLPDATARSSMVQTIRKFVSEDEQESPLAAVYRQKTLFILMALFGFVVGIIAFIYDGLMELSLDIVWKVIPEAIESWAGEDNGRLELLNNWAFLYTIAFSTILGACAGLSIKYLGYPGDLPNVIKCTHNLGYVPMKQTLPMIAVSLCSIAGGGSLGPEAPLVAIAAATCGWLSLHVFNHDMVMVRKCTIIGMAAGLSAFFGVQLGGALFALEVLHTNGTQFYDVAVYAIGAGGVCLIVYRGLQGATFGEIWDFEDAPQSSATEVVLGAFIGLVSGYTGIMFRRLFLNVAKGVKRIGLGNFEDPPRPVMLSALGGCLIGVLGMLLPPTMFWAEYEIGSVADPSMELPHVWPPGGMFYGLHQFPWDSAPMYLLVGLGKLLAIAITVQAGFRGGFIFPLFFAGAAFGRFMVTVLSFLPQGFVHSTPALLCMCFAAGLNVAVTRTPFASPLILTTLSGELNVCAPAVTASLVSLFVTRFEQFIGSQKDRGDLRFEGDLDPPEVITPVKELCEDDLETSRGYVPDDHQGPPGAGSLPLTLEVEALYKARSTSDGDTANGMPTTPETNGTATPPEANGWSTPPKTNGTTTPPGTGARTTRPEASVTAAPPEAQSSITPAEANGKAARPVTDGAEHSAETTSLLKRERFTSSSYKAVSFNIV